MAISMKLTKSQLVGFIKEELDKEHIYSKEGEYMGYEDPRTQASVFRPPIDLDNMVTLDTELLAQQHFPAAPYPKTQPRGAEMSEEDAANLDQALERAATKDRMKRLKHLTIGTATTPEGENVIYEPPKKEWAPVYETQNDTKLTKKMLTQLINEVLDDATFLELSRQPFEDEYPIGRAFVDEWPTDATFLELSRQPFEDEYPIGRAFADEWPTDVPDRPRPEVLATQPLKEELFGSTEEELEEESYNDPVYQVNDVFVGEATKAAIKGLVGMTRGGRWRLTREDAEPAAAALTDKVISAVQRIAGFAIPRPNQEAFRNMIKLELQEPLHALLTQQILSVLPTYRPGGVGGETLEDLPRNFFHNAKVDMEVPLMDMLFPISEEAYRISEQGRGRGPQKSLF